MPTRDISSVRGIGVAESVRTSTFVFIFFICLLVLHAEALLLVDDQQAEVLELDVGASRRCVPMTQSTSPDFTPSITCFAWPAVRNRDSDLDPDRDSPANRSANVLPCWVASSVVGASTATCLPSWIALNAARIAISVLPKPTSPHTRRSIGIGRSMSRLDVVDRRALIGRLDERERLLHLGLPGRVLRERVALGVDALLVEHDEFLGDLADRGA